MKKCSKTKRVIYMNKLIAIASVIMMLSSPIEAAEASLKNALKLLCASHKDLPTDDKAAKQASQIYAMLKEYERQACGERGDNFLDFLVNKYQPRLDG